ncbi:hypothetical protein PLESTF_001190800 [Pleodorina starrii]|nr:hypothetical protein PLESTF_001190800 [Pleodorina starrii]
MSTTPDPKEKEDALLEKAAALKAQWKMLAVAFNFPCEEPKRQATHWDYVLREAQWLAEDFMQERLWKQAAAARIAHDAAKFDRTKLKPVQTKVTWSVECAPEELGRVKGSLAEVPDGRSKKLPNGAADGGPAAPSTPDRDAELPGLPLSDHLTFTVLTSAEELMEALVRQLEVWLIHICEWGLDSQEAH